MKFSKPSSDVQVKLYLRENGSEVELRIEVIDSGIGISEEEQLRIFQPDFRTQNKESLN